MAADYRLRYVGRKMVRVNPSLGIQRDHYVHVVALISDFTSPAEIFKQVTKLNDWCIEEFGESKYSMDPTDDGEWFKFATKEDATNFKLTWG